MKHHVVISEEVIEEQELELEDETEPASRGADREQGSSDRERDQAKEYYEQKRRVTKPIALEDLFKKRSLKPGVPESEVQRVLLYGNPGSGKTCITKVIAHKWALGKTAQEFNAVYVVPVRVLNNAEYKGQQWAKLEAVISQICYSDRQCASDCEDLVTQIQDELDSPSTLLMVDGLDEANDHSRELVSHIWGRSCKILLLSRPYNIRNVETHVDIQVECLGFNDQQLRDYIRSELSDSETLRLISSLENSAAMWEMAHIPVTAHILCSLSKMHGTVIQEEGRRASTFQIYNDMANYVWKRFEEKPSAKNVKKSELFGDLERIAFEGLRKGMILIHERFVMQNATSKNATQTFKESGLLLFLLEGQEYQFPHLTFQEYFAGRYIAKSLKRKGSDEETRAREFIQEGKYNEKHAVILFFAMHAFAENRSKHALEEMLSIVDEQPVEILGIHHFFLRMRVLEATIQETDEAELETLSKNKQAKEVAKGARRLLERTIDNVLIREIVVEKFEHCFRVLEEFPKILNDTVKRMKKLLESSKSFTRKEEAKIKDVLKLAKHSSKHIGDIRTFLQQSVTVVDWNRSRESTVRFVDIASEIPQLAGDLLPMLQKLCSDEDFHVRASTMQAVGNIVMVEPQLMGDLLPMLQQGCGDEDFRVRISAIQVVGNIAKAETHLAGNLLLMLQQGCIDKISGVRRGAISTIGEIIQTAPHLAGDLLPMLQKGWTDEDSGVRMSTMQAIGHIPKAEQQLAGDWLPLCQQHYGKDSRERASTISTIVRIIQIAPHLADNMLSILQRGCSDEVASVRKCAMEAIDSIVNAAPRLAGDLLPMLQQGCIDEGFRVRASAMLAVGRFIKKSPKFVRDLLPMLQQGCIDNISSVRQNAMQFIGDIAKAAPHLAGDVLPVLQKGYSDEDSAVREAVKKALNSIRVDKIMLSNIFSTRTYKEGLLFLLKNAYTLASTTESEEAPLLLHTTSSEEIGQWNKEDVDSFIRHVNQEFDESFPGLLEFLKTTG